MIVIMTNQAGITLGTFPMSIMKKKMENMCDVLGGSCVVFVSGYYDRFRKPSTGMFHYLQTLFDTPLTKDNTFFCGDAYTVKNPTDIFFAHNCGIPFYTPESIFTKDTFPPSPYECPAPNFSTQILHSVDEVDIQALLQVGEIKPEIVLLIGPPASGKSTLCKDYFHNYERVNQDTLKTLAGCMKQAKKYLLEGKSVVVDNTNSTRTVRHKWVILANQMKTPIRAIMLDVPKELSIHLNLYRSLGYDGSQRKVPRVAINMFYSRYQEAVVSEGFVNVTKLPFYVKKFASNEAKNAFHFYLC